MRGKKSGPHLASQLTDLSFRGAKATRNPGSCPTEEEPRSLALLGMTNCAANSHAIRASGAKTAVSLTSTASENHTAARHRRFSTYASKAQNVNPAAAKSRWANELWAKKTG